MLMRVPATWSLLSIPLLIATCLAIRHEDVAEATHASKQISQDLFDELEELARVVDIAYCVGGLGVHAPFECANRCADFPNFELITTFNTGPLLADSCGYVALSNPPSPPRVIVAFRGTYSISNAIIDLSTNPQEFVPYPDTGNGTEPIKSASKCSNCTVHSGFYNAWLNTRSVILPYIAKAMHEHPDYQLTLVGHSLGGAVAALGALELSARGWEPVVTTFGEPRIGNDRLVRYLDERFNLHLPSSRSSFRRVTHTDDPVPLLPLTEWGYMPHGGEVYISKSKLPPLVEDVILCSGDEDTDCIAGADDSLSPDDAVESRLDAKLELRDIEASGLKLPLRYRLWQLFFAHRDYFWRLGLCVPGVGPFNQEAVFQLPIGLE